MDSELGFDGSSEKSTTAAVFLWTSPAVLQFYTHNLCVEFDIICFHKSDILLQWDNHPMGGRTKKERQTSWAEMRMVYYRTIFIIIIIREHNNHNKKEG